MITNVYKKMMTANIMGAGNITDLFGTSRTVSSLSGTNTTNIFGGNYRTHTVPTSSNASSNYPGRGIYVVTGTGTTPASESDYQLANMTNELTCNADTCTLIKNENDEVIGAKHSIVQVNNTANNVTINEIGVAADCYYSTSSNTSCWVLADRVVLDTPIVVAPSETVTFAVNVTY